MATMKRRHIPLSEKQEEYTALAGEEFNDTDISKEKVYKYQPQPQQPVVYSSNKVNYFTLFIAIKTQSNLYLVEHCLFTTKSTHNHYYSLDIVVFLDKI